MNIATGSRIYPERRFTTLIEMLRQTAELYGSQMAYMFRRKPGEHVHYRTYGELLDEVELLGTGLIQYGLKNKKIALLSENAFEWAVCYHAVINGAGVIVPFDAKLPKGEIVNLMQCSGSAAIFFSPKQLDKAVAAAAQCDAVRYFICMDPMKPQHTKLELPDDPRFIRYSDIRQAGADAISRGDRSFIDAEIDCGALAALIYTSGTTSLAKGVMLSMENLCENVIAGTGSIFVKPGERVLSVLPLHHTFETTAGMLIPMFYGACICVNDGLRHLAANLMEWSINILVAVPLLIENIYKRVDESIEKSGKQNLVRVMRPLARTMKYVGVNANRRMFRSVIDGLGGGLRMIVVGAAAMDRKIIDAFMDYGIEFYQGYGMTEHAPIISVTTAQNNVPGSVGPPIPGVEVTIDESVTDGEGSGEILVRSKSVMLGYFDRPDATEEALAPGGWLRTGDMGYVDQNHSLHITGRCKSMIVLTNGKKAFPEEIELYLNLIPGVVDSLVWGERNGRDAVDICAELQIRRADLPIDDQSDSAISEYLKNHVKYINKKVPPFKVIKYFVFTEHDMARTTTMKIKRHVEVGLINDKLAEASLTMRTADGRNVDLLKD